MSSNKEKREFIPELLPNLLVVVRHGESEKNKKNQNRQLTELGRIQIRQTAEDLMRRFGNQAVKITCTPTVRTRQSAEIIATKIGQGIAVTEIPENVAFIGDWSSIYFKKLPEETLTQAYFRLGTEFGLSSIKSPQKYSDDLLSYIANTNLGSETLVLVTHAGEGDALQKQDYFQPETPISWQKELDCGEIRFLLKK